MSLVTNARITKDTIASLETFVCNMYGKKKLSSVGETTFFSVTVSKDSRGTKYVAELWLSLTTHFPPAHLPEEMV